MVKMTRCKVKTPGPQRRFDHEEIKRGIRLNLSNSTIAAVVGCTPGYVWELRNKEEMRKRRLSRLGIVCWRMR